MEILTCEDIHDLIKLFNIPRLSGIVIVKARILGIRSLQDPSDLQKGKDKIFPVSGGSTT